MDIIDFENSLKDIVNRYPQTPENEWIFEMHLPKRKTSNVTKTGDLLSDLFASFDLSALNIMGIVFSNKIKEDSMYVYFGGYDTSNIVVDKQSGEIAYVTEDDVVAYLLAETLTDYLKIFVALSEYSIKGYFEDKAKKIDRRLLVEECKSIVKYEKYFPYYLDHFWNEEDSMD